MKNINLEIKDLLKKQYVKECQYYVNSLDVTANKLKRDKMEQPLINIVTHLVKDYFDDKPEYGKILLGSKMSKHEVPGIHIAVIFTHTESNEYSLQLVFTVENNSEKILMGQIHYKGSIKLNTDDFNVCNISEL